MKLQVLVSSMNKNMDEDVLNLVKITRLNIIGTTADAIFDILKL